MGQQWHNLSRVTTSLAIFFIISIFLPSARAENKTYPTANQNLWPLQAWRSAEDCLQKVSSVCQDTFNYTLTDSGWLNVTLDDGPKFCSDGCADHTRAVLECLHEVMKDYWFANHANIQDVNDTINAGCNSTQGFTGVSKYGSHGFRLTSAPIFIVISAAALLFVTF